MAAEVQVGRYMFRPHSVGVMAPLAIDNAGDGREFCSPFASPTPWIAPSKAPLPSPTVGGILVHRRDGVGYEDYPGQGSDQHPIAFAYNPAHDFEALIWIGNYFIFNKRVVGHSQSTLR